MATTKLDQSWNVGATWNNGTANYTFRLEVIQESQNIGTNQSLITVNKYVKGNSGNSWYGYACTDAFSGDISDTITYNPAQSGSYGPMRNTEVLYHTQQFTITHTADGSKQINITTTFTNGGYSYAPKTNTQTFTVTLDTIPRASTIQLSASSLTIGGTSGNITWTATSKANYYHTLTWSLGSTTQTISALNHLNNTTQSGTIAYTTLLNALPTSASGTLTLTLKTYSSSAKTTQIGSDQTTTCSINITLKPETSLLNIFIADTPINNYAIAGYSKIASDFSATTPYGATGITTYFTISSGSMDTKNSTLASGTARSNKLPANTSDATVTISAYTKDSRGITGATVTKSITVYGYTVPNASLTAFRTTQTGVTQDSGGAYLYAVFSGSVSKSFDGRNTATVTCNSTGGYSGTLTSGNHYSLSVDRSATVTLTVTDTVGGENKIVVQVPTAVFAIDMYDDGEGTVGVGLGGIAPEDAMINAYLPVRFGNNANPTTTRYYSANGYTDIGAISSLSGSKKVYWPNKGGTVAMLSDIQYSSGDTVTMNTYVASGFITTSTTQVIVTVIFAKALTNISTITCTTLNVSARGISGYLNNQSGNVNYTNDTTNYTIACTKLSGNAVRLALTKTSAFTNVTNNTPVALYGTFAFTLT